MREFQHLLAHMNAKPIVVRNFFAAFSRFEFALKRTEGYATGSDRKVEANWDKLAATLRPHFVPAKRKLKGAVDFILAAPPKAQILRKDRVLFVSQPRPTNEPELLSLMHYIRRMRNNLFHGGKFRDSPTTSPARNTKLLESGLIILEECLALCEQHVPELHRRFHGLE